MIKKILSLFLVLTFLPIGLNIVKADSFGNASDFTKTIMDPYSTKGIVPILDGETVFYKDKASDTIYIHNNGSKKTSHEASFTAPYFDDTGDVFIHKNDIEKLGFTVSRTLGRNIYQHPKSNSKIYESSLQFTNNYISLTALIEAFGCKVYKDDRGFIMTDFNNKGYYNNPNEQVVNQNVNSENCDFTDIIYRYMNFDRPSGETLVNHAKKSSNNVANLLVTPQKLQKVKDAYLMGDKETVALYNMAISKANEYLKLAPVDYVIPDNTRLFQSCVNVRDRIIALSTAYLLTDDTKYAQKIHELMLYTLDATHWPNWNCFPHLNTPAVNYKGETNYYSSTRGHFLDSGKISAGFAVGYDTLRDYLSDDEKEYIRKRVKTLLLDNATVVYNDTRSGNSYRSTNWYYAPSNWGSVVSGGLFSMCMAFAKDYDDMTTTEKNQIKYLLGNLIQSLEFNHMLIYPDFSWPEGIGYWNFVSEYQIVYCLNPLMTLCGDDYGFLHDDMFKGFFEFKNIMSGPKGVFNFTTTAEGNPTFTAQDYLYSNLTDDGEIMSNQYMIRKIIGYDSTDPREVLWYDADLIDKSQISIPLDKFYGSTGVGFFRNNFYNDQSSYAAFVANENAAQTSSKEQGSFVFDLDGVRWATDIGYEVYDLCDFLPNVLDANGKKIATGNGRQRAYRYRAEGNNCVVINPQNETDPENNPYGGQDYGVKTKLLEDRCAYSKTESFAQIDLSDIYKTNVTDYKRGYYFGDNRTTLTVRDEIVPKNTSVNNTVYWFMHTRADIQISPDGKVATLTQNGKQVKVTAKTSSSNWSFAQMGTTYLLPKTGGEYEEGGKYASIVKDGRYVYSLDGVNYAENQNTGVKKLFIKLDDVKSNCFIEVKISRDGSDANKGALSTWSVDQSKEMPLDLEFVTKNIIESDLHGNANVSLIVPHDTTNIKLFYADNLIYDDSDEIFSNLKTYRIDPDLLEKANANLKAQITYGNSQTGEIEKHIAITNPINALDVKYEDFSCYDSYNEGANLASSGASAFTYAIQNVDLDSDGVKEAHMNITKKGSGINLEILDNRSLYCGFLQTNPNKVKFTDNYIHDVCFDVKADNDFIMYFSGVGSATSHIAIPAFEGKIYYKLYTDRYEMKAVANDGTIVKEMANTSVRNTLKYMRFTFYSQIAGTNIFIDNFDFKSYPQDVKIVNDIQKTNGGVKVYLSDEAKDYEIYKAEYVVNDDIYELVNLVKITNETFVTLSANERLYIWDGVNPCYKYFEYEN